MPVYYADIDSVHCSATERCIIKDMKAIKRNDFCCSILD